MLLGAYPARRDSGIRWGVLAHTGPTRSFWTSSGPPAVMPRPLNPPIPLVDRNPAGCFQRGGWTITCLFFSRHKRIRRFKFEFFFFFFFFGEMGQLIFSAHIGKVRAWKPPFVFFCSIDSSDQAFFFLARTQRHFACKELLFCIYPYAHTLTDRHTPNSTTGNRQDAFS